jgi:hypothetical protein
VSWPVRKLRPSGDGGATPGGTVIEPLDRIAIEPVALMGVSGNGTINGVDTLCVFEDAGAGEEIATGVDAGGGCEILGEDCAGDRLGDVS